MAATEKKQMWFWSGTAPSVRTGLVAGSQGVMMPGSPLYLSTAGTWKLCDSTDGSDDTWQGFLVGVVDKTTTWPLTAALTANDEIRVAIIDTNQIWAVYLENNGTDQPAAQDNVGDQYGLVVSATAGEVGYTTADENDTTNVAVTVVDIASNQEPELYTTSDDPGVILVQFLNSVIQDTKG